ncbi:MAG TPA: DUF6504 family protein [Calditrichia bacterium]|nr:hypothetical protein [Calditrichota bacterium]HQU71059.1 DUF6504 family protein [Calditrichia bacterium]HQV30895.1 DUF6504 family protein [Calditrichia bacterium]
MAYQDLFEPIEVITHFHDGTISPLRFRWNGRTYRIRQLSASWQERLGNHRHIHFSVRTDNSDCCELLFDTGDFSWQIARVYMNGA